MTPAVLAPAHSQHQLADGSKQPGYTEKLIATLPKQQDKRPPAWDPYGPSVYVDPTQKHLAYVVKEAGSQFVVVDGVAQAKFDAIERIYVERSHDESIVFSRDGSRYAYLGRREDKYILVVDGKERATLEEPTRPSFGPDNRLMYVKSWKETSPEYYKGRRYSSQVIIEGLRSSSRPLMTVLDPVYTNNGRHIYYFAWDWEVDLHLFVDGLERRKFADHSYCTLKVSPDGKTVAYFFKKGLDDYLCINDRDLKVDCPEYSPKEDDSPFVLLSNGGHFIYKSEKGLGARGNWRVVIDGKPGQQYDGIGEIVMSDDGSQTAYTVYRKEKMYLVINGVATKGFDDIYGLKMTPDGKHIAYAVNEKEKAFVVFDGVYSEALSSVNKHSLAFSPDGRRLAFSASDMQNIEMLCIMGDRPLRRKTYSFTYGGYFDKPLHFSRDGRHVAFEGKAKIGYKWTFGIDGKECGMFDGPANGAAPVFDNAGRLHTTAIRDDKVYSIEIDPGRESGDSD